MKYHPITLDKARNLSYGMVAMDKIEKKLKKSFTKIDLDDMTMHELAVFIWAGLSHEDSKLTPERVMELIDKHSSISEASEAMGQAFEAAFPSPKAEEVTKNV